MNPNPQPKLVGLAALKAKAEADAKAKGLVTTKKEIQLNPNEMKDRIGIGFDDSGSMMGQKLTDAKEGVEEFLKCCNKDTTSVAIYPFEGAEIVLNTSLPATALMVKNIKISGSTPLVKRCTAMIMRNNLTRAIIFSDGQYDERNADPLIEIAKSKGIAIDTVYIASNSFDHSGEDGMKQIANSTGGIFLRFEQGKSNFRNSFKYLAPAYRAMLMSSEFKNKLENGEI